MGSDATFSASDLKISFGSLFFSVMISSVLWGVATLQLYYYCEKFWKSDDKYLKAFVVSLWLFDTIHQGLLMEINYVYFVNGMTDPELLTILPKEIGINGFIVAFIDSVIQGFYLRRVWCLSGKNWKLTGTLLLFILLQLGLTAVYCVWLVRMSRIQELAKLAHYEIIMNSSAVLSDVPLAISMIWLLKRSRSGIKKTDSVVNRLVRLTVGSGLATAVWAVIAVIGAGASPHSIVCLSTDLIFPKLYFNCMMASLNARSGLRERLSMEVVGVSLGRGRFASVVSERSFTTMEIPPKEPDHDALERQDDIDLKPVCDESTT